MSSPASKQIGRLPSQQPPDWKSIRGPRWATMRAIASSAAGVATTGGSAIRPSTLTLRSEEPESVRAVADQQVLGLGVVLEHHLVVLAPHAGDLVAAERRTGRIEVVAVGPHAPGLDGPAHAVGAGAVARPHAGAQTVERVVGDRQRLGIVLERGHGEHGAEDLLLEDPHPIVTLEHRRLEVVALGELAAQDIPLAADEALRALLEADVDVPGDLLELLGRVL